ncbi:hypothetical protein GCM10023189_37700 [Nibrella saemangeumensis]|uniref:Uracil DNA glycosylase superfamily protein n=1 Tax=Nibrella saemangeumensis TaxID=1084526 RepID=A0ABP8N8S6_9BACT
MEEEGHSQLRELYEEFLPCLYQKEEYQQAENVSWPFLMYAHEEYYQVPCKMLFVGKETHTWRPEQDKDVKTPTYSEVVEYYQTFIKQRQPASPFWRFIKSVIPPQANVKSILWTNLSKLDQGGKRPQGDLFDNTMQLFLNLLVKEIAIVKPDIVLIMTTDPHYQWHLNERFRSHSATSQAGHLPPLSGPGLPSNTFQISHPNSLQQRRLFDQTVKEVHQVIQSICQ